MGKFVNPKKIKGQDQLNRIKDLMGKMNTLTESKSFAELELIKRGPNGVVYGILRENHNYFIKTTEKKNGTFLSEDFNYVGGIQNKYDERYKSYAEALKHLNLKFDMLNESFGVKKGNNIFESDGVPTATASGGIKSGGMGFTMGNPEDDHPDQNCWEAHEKNNKDHDEWMSEQNEEVDGTEIVNTNPNPEGVDMVLDEDGEVEEQKKVIKVDAPVAAPVEDEVTDEFATAEVDEFGGEEEFEAEEEFGDEEDGDDYTKKIQKLTGKISQMIRDKDEPDGELDKYVINSVVSAINWEEISDEDVEDIIAKIEGEDEEDGEGEFGGEEEVDFEAEETVEEPTEEITEETQGSDKWEAGQKFKDSYLKGLSSKQLDKLAAKVERLQSEKDEEEVKDEDPKERDKHEEEAEEDDKKIEADAKKDAEDAEEKEKKDEKEETNESKTFSKKQLMETFLKKNTKLALKKVLNEKYAICEECLGGGCAACGGGDEESIDIASQPENIDAWTPLYEDDEGVEQQRELSGDDVREQEMDVTTALATGQDYLEATGDLDRDGDKIPNRLDLDNNDDGRLDRGMDDDFIEIDIDSIMGNPPVKEPDVAPPTTTPGTKPGKPRWKKIPRPNVDPRPKGERRRPSSLRRGIYR